MVQGGANEREGRRGLREPFIPCLHIIGKGMLRFHVVYWPGERESRGALLQGKEGGG